MAAEQNALFRNLCDDSFWHTLPGRASTAQFRCFVSFLAGFTKKRQNQVKRTTYAQTAQIRQVRMLASIRPFYTAARGCLVPRGLRLCPPGSNCSSLTPLPSPLFPISQIRKKMVEIVTKEASSCDMKELVQKLIPDSIGKEIEKSTGGIFPMQNVVVRKVKILKAPKLDITKLMEVHGDYTAEDTGAKIDRAEDEARSGPLFSLHPLLPLAPGPLLRRAARACNVRTLMWPPSVRLSPFPLRAGQGGGCWRLNARLGGCLLVAPTARAVVDGCLCQTLFKRMLLIGQCIVARSCALPLLLSSLFRPAGTHPRSPGSEV